MQMLPEDYSEAKSAGGHHCDHERVEAQEEMTADVIPSCPRPKHVAGSYLAAAKGLLNRVGKMNNVHRSHSIQQTVLALK